TGDLVLGPLELDVKNAGGGVMNFWIEESSSKIISVSPDSGTAPQTIEVTFKSPGPTGTEMYDTLWVHSNEAINSPFPVVFLYHFIDNPAQLYVAADTIELDVYECTQGYEVSPPFKSFQIINIGGDDPLTFRFEYESELFSAAPESADAPLFAVVQALEPGLPLGSYFDTLYIVAPKAINSPQSVIVRYNVIPGSVTPRVFLTKYTYTFPTQENSGPMLPSVMAIFNKFGGCMPWSIQEDVPWLDADPDSGNVPGETNLDVSAAGYTFGQYEDSLFIVAPTADNSPKKILLIMKVWRFHGDWDYNGSINIVDLVLNVDFLFHQGAMPQPEYIVGDLNCDHTVNVADLTYFVDYMFHYGPIPCGNPYK
ncbi:MAG: hypothetical protein AB1744_09865, partial [Candidatus Zixiibacteriota bacterium]